MAEAKGNDYLLVAAIDFGTTYSGYAFSTRDEFKTNPINPIHSKIWHSCTGGVSTHKIPTCALFKQNGTFHSFGYQAEDKYMDLAENKTHEKWFFFSRFKMNLYNKAIIKNDMELKDAVGKPMSALKVFSASIKFLKDNLMEKYRDTCGIAKDLDIKWVLTVPAIWTDAAKAFMRIAAEKAGINNDQLVICLEPEAAALYVKETSLEDQVQAKSGDSYQPFFVGAKYLVCDAGGGTVDVTVQEVQTDGGIKELYRANGGDWGGTKVDEALQYVLCELLGEDVITQLSKEETAEFLAMFINFEVKKRSISPETDSSIYIRLPARLNEIYMDKNGGNDMTSTLKTRSRKSMVLRRFDQHFALNQTCLSSVLNEGGVEFKNGNKLVLKPILTKLLFQDSTRAISEHLKTIFYDVKDVDTILLVGGYSESPMLRECIRRHFPQKRVKIPLESGLAVLRGAVIYGHNPKVFIERISRYTYGLKVAEPYMEGKHNQAYKFVNERKAIMCSNIFHRFIQRGRSVFIGKTHSCGSIGFTHRKERNTYPVYCSTKPNPKYTTDPGCTKLGEVVLDIPLSDLDIHKDKATIEFSFIGTEFEVKVVFNKTGKTAKSFFKFET